MQGFIPRNYTKFCYTPWPFQGLKPRPWKYRTNFSWSLLEIPRCFKLTAGKSTCYFFNTPGNSIFSTPLLVFFWDGPVLFEIEKKLKTKKLLNITILDEQESATEPKKMQVWSWNMYQLFTKTWKLAIAVSVSENK